MRKLLDGFTPGDVFEAVDGDVPRTALFTSFTFSPAAFNDQYLRELQQRGCEQVTVLVDPLGYAQSLDDAAYAEGIGTDYVLRAVRTAGAFHAKLVVVQTPRKTILGVGSGNLTVSGMLVNAEVGGLCVVESDTSQQAIADTCQKLISLAGIRESSVQVIEPILVADDTWFLTSLGQPIADQLAIESGVESIIITSPFVDQSKRVMTWLRDKWPAIPIRIRIDPIFENLSADFIKTLDSETTVQVPVDPSDAACGSVHGKLFVWRRGNGIDVMLGSANMTAAALLENKNIEAVLVRRMPTSDANYLLRVPEIRWRKVTASDVVSEPRHLEPSRPVKVLVAELYVRQLSLAWQGGTASGELTMLVRGNVVAQRNVDGHLGAGGRVTADVLLTKEEIVNISGPRVARVLTNDGTLFVGWVEVKELLDTPPEAKKRLQFLRDLSAGPESCKEDDVVHFLEWLRRGLQEDHLRRRRSTASGPQHNAEELDRSIERSLLLVEEAYPQQGIASGWERLVEASFDLASSSIQFFDAELREANRSASSKTRTQHRNEDKASHRPAAPPSVLAILRALFEQMAQSLDVVDDVESVATRLRQLPMCLKALKFCATRWHISSQDARRFLTPVVFAFLGPGKESVIQKCGVLKRLTPIQCKSLTQYHGLSRSISYLHGILLSLWHYGDLQRADAVKDMHDLILSSFDCLSASDVDELQDELCSVLGDEGKTALSFGQLQESLVTEEGEIGRIQRQRDALRKLVLLIREKGANAERVDELCREATSTDAMRRHLATLLHSYDGSRSSIHLEEVGTDSDACPHCFMAIAQGEFARMSDATFVHRHSCGALLVRSID